MQHVKDIKDLVENGDIPQAENAIENLLILGPNNVEALKIKALIAKQRADFKSEGELWYRISEIDSEDQDAISYYINKQLEERERFYFTDPLQTGGRRYIAYPKALLHSALMGIVGSIGFFTLSRITHPLLLDPRVVFSLFGLMVVTPWIAIIWTWLRATKSVTLDEDGILVEWRLGQARLNWVELKNSTLCYKDTDFFLLLEPKNEGQRPLMVDLSEHQSSLRSRSFFVQEVKAYCPSLDVSALETIESFPKNTRFI